MQQSLYCNTHYGNIDNSILLQMSAFYVQLKDILQVFRHIFKLVLVVAH